MCAQLHVKQYKQSGDLAHEYNAFKNIKLANDITIKNDDTTYNTFLKNILYKFDTNEITCSINHPVEIQCQPSYDGTVNLIINDNYNPPRLINSRFSVRENNTYKIINRNQDIQTNIYHENKIDAETRLFKNVRTFPIFDLISVDYAGQLPGGNYIFYLKYCDDDTNETEIVAESGLIQIFKGSFNNLKSISGALINENTDKSITLKLSNLDNTYSKFNLYFSRDTCDGTYTRNTLFYKVNEPYEFTEKELIFSFNGYEEITQITSDDINIQYNVVDTVKSQTQVQNMLFFGNIKKNVDDNTTLATIAQYVNVTLKQKNDHAIQWVNHDYTTITAWTPEYYNPNNTYYYLGYWPNEIYRLGMVFVYNDDTCSAVYNLHGRKFNNVNETNKSSDKTYNRIFKEEFENNSDIVNAIDNNEITLNSMPFNDFLKNGTDFENTWGVFQLPNLNVIDYNSHDISPIYFEITLPWELLYMMYKKNIKGYFFVRQKRIPITLAQGLTCGVDKYSYIPCLYNTNKNEYMTEALLTVTTSDPDDRFPLDKQPKLILDNTANFNNHIIYTSEGNIDYSGIFSLETTLTSEYRSIFDGSTYNIRIQQQFNRTNINANNVYYDNAVNKNILRQSKLLYIDTDVPVRSFEDRYFSTRKGNDLDKQDISSFGFDIKDYKDACETGIEFILDIPDDLRWFEEQRYKRNPANWDGTTIAQSLVRGIYSDFIGSYDQLPPASICDLMISNYDESKLNEYIKIRGNDLSPYYAISNRYMVIDSIGVDSEGNNGFNMYGDPAATLVSPIINLFRGDCYTCTVSIRINRNFVDSYAPVTDAIISPWCWTIYYRGDNTLLEKEDNDDASTGAWNEINISDLNNTHLGHWITFKCLANTNLGLRSDDTTNVEEFAKMGNSRSFYPRKSSRKNAEKIAESLLLNKGYSSTLGQKLNMIWNDVPYTREEFNTRIMFSNVQENNAFKNSYRIFQGLSYQDIDSKYGSITKILDWGPNILAIFEHGIALVPVNEKALMNTTSGQSIHLYGAGVLQQQVTPYSVDYGSIWKDSIVRTERAIYGVDTYAKKIWRVINDNVELISDQRISRFLNDHIELKELDKYETIGLRNVVSHYNAYKGDIMFTFYNYTEDMEWSICYNERMDKFITRYSWIPILSANINNIFYSIDKKRIEPLVLIAENNQTDYGIYISSALWKLNYSLTAMPDPKSSEKYIYDKNGNKVYLSSWQLVNPEFTINLKNMDFYDYKHFDIEYIQSSYIDDDFVERKIMWVKSEDQWKYDADVFLDLIEYSETNESTYTYRIIYNDNKIVYPEEIGLEYSDSNAVIQFNPLAISTYNIKTKDGKYIDYPLFYWNFKLNSNTLVKTTTISNKNSDGEVIEVEKTQYVVGASNSKLKSIVIDYDDLFNQDDEVGLKALLAQYNRYMQSGFFVHGRAGIFDEINYKNYTQLDNIRPTMWYNKQEPFEFEFVVNQPLGIQKIFNNLVIISNNAEPNSLEVEIIGDAYEFSKEFIYWSNKHEDNVEIPVRSQRFLNCNVIWDNQANQFALRMDQPLHNIKSFEKYGRILGNIEYKEDSWNVTINPIRWKDLKLNGGTLQETNKTHSARLRDKYAKIKIKYKGDKLVLITAIKTLITLSYA